MGPRDSLRAQAERLNSEESRTCLLPYCALHRVTLPTTLLGKAAPESHLPGAVQFYSVSRTRALWGPHPHCWPSSRRLNFLLALRWVEGQRGVSAPTPPPSSGFRLETDCAASSSHQGHYPSHHSLPSLLFSWAWRSLPAKIPLTSPSAWFQFRS